MQESENVAAGWVQRIMKLHTRTSADDSKARLVSAIDVEKWSLSPSHSYPVVAAKLAAGFMMSPTLLSAAGGGLRGSLHGKLPQRRPGGKLFRFGFHII